MIRKTQSAGRRNRNRAQQWLPNRASVGGGDGSSCRPTCLAYR